MNHSKVCRWVVCLLMQLFFVASAQAQLLYYNKVDTLKFGQRFNFRTNTVDWLALTPNVGVEFTLGNRNWSKWTVGAQGRFNWKEQSKEPRFYIYDLYDGRIQLRKYWHGKNPTSVFYWGVYAGANSFDIKLGKTGYKGTSAFGGLSFGYVKQLYGYTNGSSLDLDLGVNAGVVFAKYKEYTRELRGNRFEYVTTKPEKGYKPTFSPLIYAAATDAVRVSLVYHFGPIVANKYKKRVEVDNDYRVMLATLKLQRDSTAAAQKVARKIRKDSLEKLDYEKRFEQQHRELERKFMQDSLKNVRAIAYKERQAQIAANKRTTDSLRLANKMFADSLKQANKHMVDSLRAMRKRGVSAIVPIDTTTAGADTTVVSDTATSEQPVDTTMTTPTDTTTTVPAGNEAPVEKNGDDNQPSEPTETPDNAPGKPTTEGDKKTETEQPAEENGKNNPTEAPAGDNPPTTSETPSAPSTPEDENKEKEKPAESPATPTESTPTTTEGEKKEEKPVEETPSTTPAEQPATDSVPTTGTGENGTPADSKPTETPTEQTDSVPTTQAELASAQVRTVARDNGTDAVFKGAFLTYDRLTAWMKEQNTQQ